MKTLIQAVLFISLFLGMGSLAAGAQSAGVKKAAKSVLTLTTFKDGALLASSHGVFVSADGEGVSPWKPFVGADSAIVVDADGRSYQVESLLGASSIYDICKFRVVGKTTPAMLATAPTTAGGKVWVVGYGLKKPVLNELTIHSVEKFDTKYNYYIIKTNMPDNSVGCPVVNEQGQAIGILQQSETSVDLFATDVQFANTFKMEKGFTVNDPTLQQTNIRLELPADEKEALIVLVMAREQYKGNYAKYVDAFIQKFPASIDGYARRAQMQVANRHLAEADKTMRQAIDKVTDKDQAHSEFSKIMYQQQLYQPDSAFTAWSLDKALEEAEKAYAIKADPAYRHQQAQIIYSKRDYEKALDIFNELSKTSIRNSEIFYEAAQCKMQLKAPQGEVMALLDSAVVAAPQPLTQISAPYFLARGVALDNAGELRKALADYNRYDTLMLGRASADFYYTRYKCEVKLKQYQQALGDIAHAVVLSPNDPSLVAEMASLELRVRRYDEAIRTSEMCLKIDAKNTDALVIKGVALLESNRKEEGMQALQQAKELGDERGQQFIDKYSAKKK